MSTLDKNTFKEFLIYLIIIALCIGIIGGIGYTIMLHKYVIAICLLAVGIFAGISLYRVWKKQNDKE